MGLVLQNACPTTLLCVNKVNNLLLLRLLRRRLPQAKLPFNKSASYRHSCGPPVIACVLSPDRRAAAHRCVAYGGCHRSAAYMPHDGRGHVRTEGSGCEIETAAPSPPPAPKIEQNCSGANVADWLRFSHLQSVYLTFLMIHSNMNCHVCSYALEVNLFFQIQRQDARLPSARRSVTKRVIVSLCSNALLRWACYVTHISYIGWVVRQNTHLSRGSLVTSQSP
jgi:hypothetical protein